MDAGTALLLFFSFVGLLVFLALTATAIFRPSQLPTLIEALKVLGLALIGKRYSDRDKSDPP